MKQPKPMSINDWVKYIHTWAKRKGWWDKRRSPLEMHALMHSEIAEATEEVRKGNKPLWYNDTFEGGVDITVKYPEPTESKPEGEAVELADAVIRIMDYFAYRGWDLGQVLAIKMKYNEKRPYRHGNKKF